MLTTLIVPTGGRAWVSGIDVVADPVGVKRTIGVVPQNNTLDMQLSVSENLEFRSRFFGLGRREALRRADQLLAAFGLTDRRRAMATDCPVARRRLMIARALVHRPGVLFLDEPTAGLDPQTRVNLWDTLRLLHDEGQTILLTTHYMEEAEALCQRVAVVDHGRVLASGTVDELKEDAGADTVITVRYDGGVPAEADVLAVIEGRRASARWRPSRTRSGCSRGSRMACSANWCPRAPARASPSATPPSSSRAWRPFSSP